MKRIALIACIALAGCGVNSQPVASTPVVAAPAPAICASNILMDERGIAALELAYNVPASLYVTADKNGVLPAKIKAATKPMLVDMYGWLLKARAAKKIGDNASFACSAVALGNLSDAAKILLK